MSRQEIEQAVERVLEQRGTTFSVDVSRLRDDLLKKLIADLDKLGADYTISDQRISVEAPAEMSKGHAILTLFRYNDLEVEGL